MLQNMLSSRAVLASLVFCVLIVSGSLFYNWHIRHTTDAELAQSKALLQQRENQNEARTAQDPVDTSTVDFEHAETLFETDAPQMMETGDTVVLPRDDTAPIDLSDAFLPDDFVSKEALVEEVPISPFGFGAYPEVPADYPKPDIWDRIDNMTDRGLAREVELMERVCIKLWNQGIKAIGASFHYSDGKIYPTIPGVAYVKWKWEELPDGTRQRYASRISGPPELVGKEHYIYELGIAPPGITIVDYEEGGIDPYEFLNLQR